MTWHFTVSCCFSTSHLYVCKFSELFFAKYSICVCLPYLVIFSYHYPKWNNTINTSIYYISVTSRDKDYCIIFSNKSYFSTTVGMEIIILSHIDDVIFIKYSIQWKIYSLYIYICKFKELSKKINTQQ
jgi:hypothetical protein